MKDKSKDKREFSDRRKKKSKSHKDKRAELRRDEDRKNLATYYITLYGAFGFIMALGIASYFYKLGE
ncbi:MAG: hypothetical protein GY793_02375 [Proteobacteria bacterium]|nr:hypothetical protein [Pseudomonadota bacterium]